MQGYNGTNGLDGINGTSGAHDCLPFIFMLRAKHHSSTSVEPVCGHWDQKMHGCHHTCLLTMQDMRLQVSQELQASQAPKVRMEAREHVVPQASQVGPLLASCRRDSHLHTLSMLGDASRIVLLPKSCADNLVRLQACREAPASQEPPASRVCCLLPS